MASFHSTQNIYLIVIVVTQLERRGKNKINSVIPTTTTSPHLFRVMKQVIPYHTVIQIRTAP